MNTLKVIMGFLAGAAAGIVVGIIITPSRRKARNRRYYKTGEGFVDKVEEKIDDIEDTVKRKIRAARKEVRKRTESEPVPEHVDKSKV
jgi:gas vesicle protein